MILAGNAGVVANAIREIFGLLDKAVYWVLVHVVNLLTDIARTNVLTESTIQTFANRIYFIMGTIMFFKMAVSIITYIVDPDKLTDSKTGFASIIKNTVIALVMVVAVPIVFRYAMFAQEAILQDDTIGRLITGKTGGTQNNVGDTVATNILSGFIHPDEDIVGGECNNLGYSEECKTKLATYSADLALTYSYIDPTVRTSQGVPGSPYGYVHLIDLGTANDVHKTGGAKDYVIDYKVVLSTLAGGFAVYIFLLSCFDVAVRTVKFAFLQIIAPIPIATYIDEKGKTMFNNWRKACVSTYVDLFIRLAAVQFGIFMITEFVGDLTNHGICSTQIQNGQIITGACRRPGIFVELFIIFGILLFIKEVPKLVEQITGIKLDGKFELGFRKRLSGVPLIGGAAAAGLTMGSAGLLAGGRLATGAIAGVGKGLASLSKGNSWAAGWKSGWGDGTIRAGYRMKAGIEASKSNLSNLSGNGKYVGMKDSYNKLTENFKKGTEQFKNIHKSWEKGKDVEDKLANNGLSFSNFDGVNNAAYQLAYSHQEFINSLMNMDKQDAINKEYINALYAAQTGATSVTVDGVTYGNGLGPGHEFTDLKKDAEKSQKTLTGYEKVHDTMRQKYSDDAKTQDNIKTKKYNQKDPTK